MQVNFEDTKRLVSQCAKRIAGEIDEDIHEDALWPMVEDECEQFAHGDVCNGLQILASYGWSDALHGGVDYEDSPIRLFEEDVYKRVEQLLWDDDIAVIGFC